MSVVTSFLSRIERCGKGKRWSIEYWSCFFKCNGNPGILSEKLRKERLCPGDRQSGAGPSGTFSKEGKRQCLFPQDSQAVDDNEEAGAHIGEDGHPHGGFPGQRQCQEDSFQAEREHDVLHEDSVDGF